MEIYEVNFCIKSEFGKMKTRKAPNTDTFHEVICTLFISYFEALSDCLVENCTKHICEKYEITTKELYIDGYVR